jgi:hypothetical protein
MPLLIAGRALGQGIDPGALFDLGLLLLSVPIPAVPMLKVLLPLNLVHSKREISSCSRTRVEERRPRAWAPYGRQSFRADGSFVVGSPAVENAPYVLEVYYTSVAISTQPKHEVREGLKKLSDSIAAGSAELNFSFHPVLPP